MRPHPDVQPRAFDNAAGVLDLKGSHEPFDLHLCARRQQVPVSGHTAPICPFAAGEIARRVPSTTLRARTVCGNSHPPPHRCGGIRHLLCSHTCKQHQQTNHQNTSEPHYNTSYPVGPDIHSDPATSHQQRAAPSIPTLRHDSLPAHAVGKVPSTSSPVRCLLHVPGHPVGDTQKGAESSQITCRPQVVFLKISSPSVSISPSPCLHKD